VSDNWADVHIRKTRSQAFGGRTDPIRKTITFGVQELPKEKRGGKLCAVSVEAGKKGEKMGKRALGRGLVKLTSVNEAERKKTGV